MADRTVTVQLRADVAAYIAAMRAAQRATRDFGDEVERAGGRTERNFQRYEESSRRVEDAIRRLLAEQRRLQRQQDQNNESTRRAREETDRHRESTDRSAGSTRRASFWDVERSKSLNLTVRSMMSLVAAASILAAPILSATVALGAFGTLGAQSVYRVIAAQKDLTTSWSGLSQNQRASALLVHNLTTEYKQLARSYEPETLAAFNTMVSAAKGLLPKLADTVDASGHAVQNFSNRFAQFLDVRGGELLEWAGREAPQALDVLGTTLFTTGDTFLDLIEDLEPLGITFLQFTNGVLSAINALAGLNPAIAQLAFSALLLRAPVAAMFAGIGGVVRRTREFTSATRGASFASRGLSLLMASGPALFVAAGVGLAFLVIKMTQMKSETDKLNSAMQIQFRAFGNNLAGHQEYADFLDSKGRETLQRMAQAQAELSKEENKSGQARRKAKGELEELQRAFDDNRESADKEALAIRNLTSASDQLAKNLGITADEARQMATAAGVDLTMALDKNGKFTDDARKKIDEYRQAVELSNDPIKAVTMALERAGNVSLTVKHRVEALRLAFESLLGPSLAVFTTTTQLRVGFRRLLDQFNETKGGMDGNSMAALKLQQVFAQQIQTVWQLVEAMKSQGKSNTELQAAVGAQIPLLYAFAGTSKEARAQVDALAKTIGLNVSQLNVSKSAFIAHATVMLGDRAKAEQLWTAFQKLSGAIGINTGRTALNKDSFLRAASALNIAETQANQLWSAYQKLTGGQGTSIGRTNVSKDAFLKLAASLNIAEDRALELWKMLGKLPPRKETDIFVKAQGEWVMARANRQAEGGAVPSSWPGARRGQDSVPSLLMPDEHVWTTREVAAAGGHGAMYRLREAALRGEIQGFATGGPVAPRRFARGGRVDFGHDKRATPVVAGDVMKPINDGYIAIVKAIGDAAGAEWKKYMASGGAAMVFARAQAGKPYVWGGVGPGGYDCSGFTSAITNVIQGRYPYSRRHTTHNFGFLSGPDGFIRNYSGPTSFYVGVTDAGVGHMAGTLAGVAVESSGSGNGVRVGGGARGANHPMFTRYYGLRMAEGGPVGQEYRRLADQALRRPYDDQLVGLAASLGLIGDPSSPITPAYDRGGWITGRPGRDANLIRATSGEFMINRRSAMANPGLVESINSNRGGQVGPTVVHVHMTNEGVIGSQIDMDNWISRSIDRLDRSGRAPWPTR